MENTHQHSADHATYMQADAMPIESCLTAGSIGMSRAIMEAVASGSVTTVVDVQRFIRCTLLAATSDFQVSWFPDPPPPPPPPPWLCQKTNKMFACFSHPTTQWQSLYVYIVISAALSAQPVGLAVIHGIVACQHYSCVICIGP